MSDAENFYDTEIAPKLRELMERCAEHGMSFLASVEYEPGSTGETCMVLPGAGVKIHTAHWGIKCHGNIDSFVIAATRYGREHGHSSFVLSMLGEKPG